ncbi:MAG: HxsD-like protein [Candidatus Woesearchaeota archaeon]
MAVVRLNKSLYRREAIDIAVKDFRRIASFSITEGKKDFIINIKSKGKSLRLPYEFANYVLAVMKNNSMV